MRKSRVKNIEANPDNERRNDNNNNNNNNINGNDNGNRLLLLLQQQQPPLPPRRITYLTSSHSCKYTSRHIVELKKIGKAAKRLVLFKRTYHFSNNFLAETSEFIGLFFSSDLFVLVLCQEEIPCSIPR